MTESLILQLSFFINGHGELVGQINIFSMNKKSFKQVSLSKKKAKFLLTVTLFFSLMGGILTACSDDDKDSPATGIVGEWISDDGDLYYRFNSNGTGRYICLGDEPGYNPEYPDAAINHPIDPYDFTYKIEGDHILISTPWTNYEGKEIIDQEDYLYDLSGNTLQLKCLRFTSENGEWQDASSSANWKVYKRR